MQEPAWGWWEYLDGRYELFIAESDDDAVVDSNRRAIGRLLAPYLAPRCMDEEAVWIVRKLNKKGVMSTGWSLPENGMAIQLVLGLGVEGTIISSKLYEECRKEVIRENSQKNLRLILGYQKGRVQVLQPALLSANWLVLQGASALDSVDETLSRLVEGGVLSLAL